MFDTPERIVIELDPVQRIALEFINPPESIDVILREMLHEYINAHLTWEDHIDEIIAELIALRERCAVADNK